VVAKCVQAIEAECAHIANAMTMRYAARLLLGF
jgi:hypothetical protein